MRESASSRDGLDKALGVNVIRTLVKRGAVDKEHVSDEVSRSAHNVLSSKQRNSRFRILSIRHTSRKVGFTEAMTTSCSPSEIIQDDYDKI